MSLQAPLLKYSPCHQPTTSYQIIIVVYSAYNNSLQIYQQDKIHTHSLGADSFDLLGKKYI